MTSGKDTTQHEQDNDISKGTTIQERVANEAEINLCSELLLLFYYNY